MSVERWWSRTKLITPPEPVVNPCPICTHLNAWYGEPIAESTHGAGGPDWEWRACFKHYKVLSAAQFIGLLRPPTGRAQ